MGNLKTVHIQAWSNAENIGWRKKTWNCPDIWVSQKWKLPDAFPEYGHELIWCHKISNSDHSSTLQIPRKYQAFVRHCAMFHNSKLLPVEHRNMREINFSSKYPNNPESKKLCIGSTY
jgi:hypothetical protein